MVITYRSTRGKQTGLRFEEVVLGGLATDKGLFVPETIPHMSLAEIESVDTCKGIAETCALCELCRCAR